MSGLDPDIEEALVQEPKPKDGQGESHWNGGLSHCQLNSKLWRKGEVADTLEVYMFLAGTRSYLCHQK